MGCVPLPLVNPSNNSVVIAVGRGGGHSPPETPDGVSLVDDQGKTLWTLPLDGFMSTMSFHRHDDQLLVFHGNQHLWVDIATGEITRQVNFVDTAPVRSRTGADRWETKRETTSVKKRGIIQQSNILAGDYHYVRHYSKPWLGRIHAKTGEVQYLQLPVQMKRTLDAETFIWSEEDVPRPVLNWRNGKPLAQIRFNNGPSRPMTVKNSRGYEVMGDVRSRGNGWGHHAGATPTVIGDYLYIPIMSGNVYVIRWNAEQLDEQAIVAINDLGPVGETWTRANISFAGGRLYAHTIKNVICIQPPMDSTAKASP